MLATIIVAMILLSLMPGGAAIDFASGILLVGFLGLVSGLLGVVVSLVVAYRVADSDDPDAS